MELEPGDGRQAARTRAPPSRRGRFPGQEEKDMERKRVLLSAAAALLACAALGAPAGAEESPCKADIEKFCGDVQPGEGRILKCLKEHEAELSAGCKEKGTELKEKAEAIKEACQADLDRFCKDVEPGEGRLAKCLKAHEQELSAVCTNKIAGEKEEFMKGHPCVADMENLCKDVEPGEGRKLKCMKEREAELSAECRAKMAEKWEEVKKAGPCGPDIEKFCKDVQPGEGRIVHCLKAHEHDLSAECKEKGEELKDNVADFNDACRGDLDRFCKDVQPGEGRLLFCLKKHKKELAAPCRAKMGGGEGKRNGMMHGKREEKGSRLRETRLDKQAPATEVPGKRHPEKK